MNKEQQIEEMAQIICGRSKDDICLIDKTSCDSSCRWARDAKALYDAGYRKVPENAVILTPEERDEEMKEINKTLAERDELKDRIAELEKENETKTDTITDLLKKQEFYETEKLKQFAERLKKRTILYSGINVKYEAITADIIDEVLKEYEE